MAVDLRSEPFQLLLTLGESTVHGMCATTENRRWVNLLADLISEFQGQPVRLLNQGISANSISARSPGYEASAKPSALERLQADVLAHKPDLFVCAYGLNDMRCRMHPEEFREDLRTMVRAVRECCRPVTVLTTVYHMTGWDRYAPFDRGSLEATRLFNLVIAQVAEEEGALLADIHAAEGAADWMIHPDGVHANDLGHRIIAHRVFEALAQRCSCLACTSPHA